MPSARRTKKPQKRKAPSDDPLTGFLPPVRAWFKRTFARPSPAQVQAWPVIRSGDNTLLLAPTGSGKTLSAFLCAIDSLVRRDRAGELTDAIHVLYITPLKALGNDIQRNLIQPLQGIRGADRIRTAVRTGDTPQSERAKMVRRPPHILITTPESLYLLLQSVQIRDALKTIRTVIVDEVHALCDNKRGVHLSVSLERLERHVDGPLQRVGCSATLSPLKEIAAFLVGRAGKTRRRPCTIVDAGMRKNLDLRVMAPLADLVEAGNTALWASAYDLLVREISDHTTTLVFCNSRYKAERTGLRLTELAGEDLRLGVHHGSVARERRLVAEEDLKSGRLEALVATTSLELGIDIGSVDLVYQLESPKSVSTGLQRIGRAGHLLDATSKGRILVFERDELLEAAAICRAMVEGEIDAVHILQGCLDVLAQQIVGAVVARDWDADELYGLIRQAYPYRELERDDFDRVLTMLSGDFPFEMTLPPRAYVHWDRTTDHLSATRGAKHTSSMNVGTISESSEYEVIIDGSRRRVGRVNSEFVDDSLRVGDVFVLGSTTWRVTGVRKNQLLVKEAPGATPTVPWWTGPIQPRTIESGEFVGRLRREIAERLESPELDGWLQETYHLDPNAASAASEYVREQMAVAGMVPDHENLLIETWTDELGRINVVLHSPFGQRANHTWGICLAEAARSHLQQEWQITATNDHLLLGLPEPETPPVHKPDAEKLLALVGPGDLPNYALDASSKAIGAGTAFRDAASVAYQILRAHSGKRVPFWLQSHRAHELFEIAGKEQTYPIVSEVVREYRDSSLDVPGLTNILRRVASGKIRLHFKTVESPSPFVHSLLIQEVYESSHEMGRSRRAHLLRLHREVLQKVLSEEQMAQLLDPRAIERVERRLLHLSENRRARSSEELAQTLRERGDLPANLDALSGICEGDARELLQPLLATHSTVAIDLVDCDRDPIRLVVGDLWREYHDAFASKSGSARPRVLLPRLIEGEIAVDDHAAISKVIPAQWRKSIPREEARRNVIERYLRCHGPVTPYDLANHTGWAVAEIETHLSTLVDDGVAAKGVYIADKPRPQFVNKVNLEEIHRLTMGYLRRELEACAPYEVVDFTTRWQHLHPDTRLEGLEGLRETIAQLQGFELVTGALESEMIGRRIRDYRPEMLDRLIASGEVCWRRFGVDKISRGKVALCLRQDAEWLSTTVPLKYDVEENADADIPEEIRTVRRYFRDQQTAFFDDVLRQTGIDEGPAMRAVWYLAWVGELTCDTYLCLRESDFQVTLSACYDLDSTPRKILSGRMSPDRVLKQMRKRGLDP
jgi:ATP-dependent helicase Lhr and Lhr-like helicase